MDFGGGLEGEHHYVIEFAYAVVGFSSGVVGVEYAETAGGSHDGDYQGRAYVFLGDLGSGVGEEVILGFIDRFVDVIGEGKGVEIQ